MLWNKRLAAAARACRDGKKTYVAQGPWLFHRHELNNRCLLWQVSWALYVEVNDREVRVYGSSSWGVALEDWFDGLDRFMLHVLEGSNDQESD